MSVFASWYNRNNSKPFLTLSDDEASAEPLCCFFTATFP